MLTATLTLNAVPVQNLLLWTNYKDWMWNLDANQGNMNTKRKRAFLKSLQIVMKKKYLKNNLDIRKNWRVLKSRRNENCSPLQALKNILQVEVHAFYKDASTFTNTIKVLLHWGLRKAHKKKMCMTSISQKLSQRIKLKNNPGLILIPGRIQKITLSAVTIVFCQWSTNPWITTNYESSWT